MSVLNGKYPIYDVAKKNVLFLFKLASDLNLNPIGQRKDTEPKLEGGVKPSKAQSIINAMFSGKYMSEFLVSIDEAIDCGHRGRYIIAFINGEFALHSSSILGAVKWKDLSPEQKDWFWNYPITWTDMYELTRDEYGPQFEQTNTITAPNFEEKMNAHGLSHTVRRLREFVEIVDYSKEKDPKYSKKGIVDDVLPFFKNNFPDLLRSKKLGWSLISVILQDKKKLEIVTEDEIRDYVHSATINKSKKLESLVEEEMKFYSDISIYWKKYKSSKSAVVPVGVCNMFRILYWILREKYSKFLIKDTDNFMKHFVHSYNEFMKLNATEKYLDENGEPADPKYGFIAKAFGSYINKITESRKIKQASEWIETFINFDEVKCNVKQSFPKEMRLKRWIENGEINEINGKPIKFEDAIGAHIISDKDDGKIVYENLLITDWYHNERMGTMNALEYKELWQAGKIS